MKRNIILHSHIFKNAGTTFDHVLERNFAEGFIDHRNDEEVINGKQQYLDKYLLERPVIKAFSSHSVHFTARSNEYFNFIQVYFMRHPIERFRSVYDFEKKQAGDHKVTALGPQMAKRLNFKEYISWRLSDSAPYTIRNCQTVFLSGEGPSVGNIEHKFELAKKNLEITNFIGVVDRYNESMVVFEHYMRPTFPNIDLSYKIKNITSLQPGAKIEEKVFEICTEIGNELFETSIIKNEFDMEIYKIANDKLDRDVETIYNFKGLLGEFCDRCSQLKS